MANEVIISSTNANLPPIGVASLESFYKQDGTGADAGKYFIVFQHTTGRTHVWEFSSSSDRNTAYTAIRTQYGFSAY